MRSTLIPRRIFNSLSPQCRKVVAHMERAGHITGDAAITYYRIMALPRRISDLEDRGIIVRRERRRHPTTGQPYVAYSLSPNQENL